MCLLWHPSMDSCLAAASVGSVQTCPITCLEFGFDTLLSPVFCHAACCSCGIVQSRPWLPQTFSRQHRRWIHATACCIWERRRVS